ncbi:hypothetical protein B0A48_11166 [Cryoendolithus antarcticus]|uniref:Uncharacterized protein n=1 Tax=Cryoendolithus antarcticus TaxID=1507870 RepID=A0A1V8SUP1_9PEZI|nr:hypothetical protein B0A48_11166 [Cryoendolithus antarcticus]
MARRRRTRPKKARSPLFKLSGEIRNIIWRFALLREEPIVFHTGGIEEEPLLLTCRAIRKETASIFYRENSLMCKGGSFDSTSLLVFDRKMISLGYELVMPNLTLGITHGTSWPNLILWLQRYHAGETAASPNYAGYTDAKSCVLESMFLLVNKLEDHPWEVVKDLLDLQRRTLVALDKGWAV